MKRIAQIIGVKPECLHEYRQLHDAIWPEISQAITQAHLHNYSIFHFDGKLFAYMEYTGDDYEGDMARLSGLEAMRRWCAICSTMQLCPGLPDGTWQDMDEVFYHA